MLIKAPLSFIAGRLVVSVVAGIILLIIPMNNIILMTTTCHNGTGGKLVYMLIMIIANAEPSENKRNLLILSLNRPIKGMMIMEDMPVNMKTSGRSCWVI